MNDVDMRMIRAGVLENCEFSRELKIHLLSLSRILQIIALLIDCLTTKRSFFLQDFTNFSLVLCFFGLFSDSRRFLMNKSHSKSD